MDTRHATVEREVPGAWRDPAHRLLQFPTGGDVLAEGVRVQGAGDDARMVVFRCGGKPLKEQQHIRFERPPPCYGAIEEKGREVCNICVFARTEEGKAGVVAYDRVTVAEMGEDALSYRGWELERRKGLVEVLR